MLAYFSRLHTRACRSKSMCTPGFCHVLLCIGFCPPEKIFQDFPRLPLILIISLFEPYFRDMMQN